MDSHTFTDMHCHGRTTRNKAPLEIAVDIVVIASERNSILSTIVECPYNGGSHGQHCYVNNEEPGICAYSFDIPHMIDNKYALFSSDQTEQEDDDTR